MSSTAIAASMLRVYEKHPRRCEQFKGRSWRMMVCANDLVFAEVVDTETGELRRKLQEANFCRDRLCPMCQWRKSLVVFRQLSQIMDRIDSDSPGAYVPVMLTLTMRNVAGGQLGAGIDRILKAWSRMMTKAARRRPWRVSAGWFRALEITYSASTDSWHPHIHAVLLMPVGYFSDPEQYIDHDGWVAEWRWALRVDYDPSVEVHTVKGIRADAVAEVSKYAVKPGDWVSEDCDETDAHVELLARELRGRRLTAFGGVMAEVRKALGQEEAETADLVHTGEDEPVRGELVLALEEYRWQIGVTNYVAVSSRDCAAEA